MVRVRLELVQLLEVWSGGRLTLMLWQKELAGLTMFMHLAPMDHSVIFLVKTLGWRHGKVVQTHVRLLLHRMMVVRQRHLVMMKKLVL